MNQKAGDRGSYPCHLIFSFFIKQNVIYEYLLLPADTSISVDYPFGGYPHGYGVDTNIIFVQRGGYRY
jgi:hypothetical protein